MGKRLKNSGNRSRKKKRRNLVENYQGSLWQNYYTVRRKGNMREKGKRGGTRIGVDRKIPQNKET